MSDVGDFPRGLSEGIDVAPSATAAWYPIADLSAKAEEGGEFAYSNRKIWLGRTLSEGEPPVGWIDDRHMITIAGSRSGKGTSSIIPNLCEYLGSIICVDPKGENAKLTACRRGFGTSQVAGIGQDVFVLDPYGTSGVGQEYLATFDPMAGLGESNPHSLEEASLIAEALVVTADQKDAHWDDSARALIEALILHVISWPGEEGDRSLVRVRELLRDGDRLGLEHYRSVMRKHLEVEADRDLPRDVRQVTAFQVLLTSMGENPAFGGVVSGIATGLQDLGEKELGSILSTARRNLKFIDASEMQQSLRSSDHTLKLEDLKRTVNGVTAYLVLPSRMMAINSRWVRLVLNLLIARFERDEVKKPRNGLPVLAILDEFPTLRHMAALENAIGYMAGFGLKIWTFLQDLSQLKRDYPNSWETFLGNAGTVQIFGNSDPTTLEYVSKRLGEIEVIREVENESGTETITISDISDFEKLSRLETSNGLLGRTLGSFRLANDTKSASKAVAGAKSVSRSIQKTALMTPDEVRRHFSRESGLQIISINDEKPIYLRRTPYHDDAFFDGKYVAEPHLPVLE